MSTKIQVPFKKLRKILHVADLHIRLFKRHSEYRETFNTLFSEWSTQNLDDTVIVVAGDIVHSKTELSPEMVDLATYFLNKCAELAPTLVIAGNHDLNLANRNRLDALSPICNNINNSNLHYLRNSEIYTVADTDFVVMSLIGDEEDWPLVSQCHSPHKIALFHGPVLSAMTDVGYVVENKHYKCEMFNGFDMVLLGDIHRLQTLQDKNPTVAYCGSLIQQNHGELPKGHGWCEWDVASRTLVHHELKNRYGYYTIRVENGIIPDYSDIPSNVRLRLFAGDMDQSDIKNLVTEIRKITTIEELAITNFAGGKKHNSNLNANVFLDLYDSSFQNKLISDYLHGTMPNLDPEVLSDVLTLNITLNDKVIPDDLARNIMWKPISLRFDNLFTYGEGNFIDFKTIKGVAGIFAPNASGKTSVAEAICFALYDRTPRTIKASSIMNRRKSDCALEFIFELDGKTYVIERKGKKNKKGEVKIDVDFYQLDNGVKISMNGEERRYTNAEIRKLVGDYEDFILTTFSSSSQTGLFVDRGQSDRKDLLSQFMGLNIFDKLHTIANEESKEIASALKRFKNDDFTEELSSLDGIINAQHADMRDKETYIKEITDRLDVLTKELQEKYQNKTPITLKNVDISALVLRKEVLEDSINTYQFQLDSNKEKYAEVTDQLEKGTRKFEEVYSNFEETLNQFRQREIDVNDLRQKVLSEEKSYKMYQEELDRLALHLYDPHCKYCLINGSHTIDRISELNDNLKKLTPVFTDRRRKLDKYDEELKEESPRMTDSNRKYKLGIEFLNNLKKTEREISNNMEIAALNIVKKSAELDSIHRDISEYYKIEDTIKENVIIDKEIQLLRIDETQEKGKLSALQKSLKAVETFAVTQVMRKKELLAKIKEAKKYETQYEVYDAYLSAVGRDGLPYKLIAEILPDLEMAVNNILNQMVEFSLKFDTDGKNVNMWLTYDEDRTWPLELASGMEKFISGLAIRVALTSVSSLPKSNMLILDEGMGALDGDNLSSIFGLFDVLRTQFDIIFLISHIDTVKDVADILVDIERNDGYSKMRIE